MDRICYERFILPVATRRAFLLAFVFLAAAGFAPLRALADDLHWKSVDGAEVKLDDKIPLTWNAYQLDKKKQPNLVLVLLGRRYILIDSKAKLVYQVSLPDVRKQGDDLGSADLAQKPNLIPSTDWTVRDVGPAEEIKLKLQDYGRTLSVQLPHPLDIRLGIY
jgi:hypothetical protein